jgi:hypothetical protein
MTTTTASPGRTTVIDRIARWTLDPDGDLYGDERERLRWYEGIAVAANLQWIAVPWAAAVLVWVLGRPSVLPLGVVLVAMYVPTVLCLLYMRRRRVETAVQRWTAKRIVLGALGGLPYVAYLLGAMNAYGGTDRSVLSGAAVGAVVGGVLAAGFLAYSSSRRRRREAATIPDVD